MVNENDKDSFLENINRNVAILHRICNVYFDNHEDREDVYQEILYQLWKSYASFSGAAKFSTWMYKVALNTAITHLKKSIRAPDKERLSDSYDQISETSEQRHTVEKMQLLYAAINTLSHIDKAIILLYLEDNSYEEIAGIMGFTKTNVSVRLVRIKKLLEEKLKDAL